MPTTPLKVFHYPRCSTCKKALAWLRAHAIAFEAIDIVASPPSVETLRRAMREAEVPLRKLFNTSGQSYRQGGFKDRLGSMSEDEALEALASDGKLIKRPLALGEEIARVGFAEEHWNRAFLSSREG